MHVSELHTGLGSISRLLIEDCSAGVWIAILQRGIQLTPYDATSTKQRRVRTQKYILIIHLNMLNMRLLGMRLVWDYSVEVWDTNLQTTIGHQNSAESEHKIWFGKLEIHKNLCELGMGSGSNSRLNGDYSMDVWAALYCEGYKLTPYDTT